MFQLPQFIRQTNRLDNLDFRNAVYSNMIARSHSLASLSQSYFRNTVEVSLIIIKSHVFKVLNWEETHACFIHLSSVILAPDVNSIPNNIRSWSLTKMHTTLIQKGYVFFLFTFSTLSPIRELLEKHIMRHDKLLNVFEYFLTYKSLFPKWTV